MIRKKVFKLRVDKIETGRVITATIPMEASAFCDDANPIGDFEWCCSRVKDALFHELYGDLKKAVHECERSVMYAALDHDFGAIQHAFGKLKMTFVEMNNAE